MLTREHVIWAYRLFLDREPEEIEATIANKLEFHRTTQELRDEFFSSPEFVTLNAGRLGLEKLAPRTAANHGQSELTRQHVLWAYRLFLNRDPESNAAICQKLEVHTTSRGLRDDFLSSPEFKSVYPHGFDFFDSTRNVVIKELDSGPRIFIDLSDCIIGLNVLRGSYEREELAFVQSVLRPGQNVLDIGANIGFFALHMAAAVGGTGCVHAFEPIPENLELLRRSVAENGFEDRIVIEPAGIGERSEERQFVIIDASNTGGTYLAPAGESVAHGHELRRAELVTLDEHPIRRPVHFIKIDIEGAEPLAFRGGREILSADRPIILSEINPSQLERVAGMSPNQFIAQMESYGYRCRLLEAARPGRILTGLEGAKIASVVFLPDDHSAPKRQGTDVVHADVAPLSNPSAKIRPGGVKTA